jgi:hypothetical protein
MIDAPVIYGLTDTSGQIVYVGQTTRGIYACRLTSDDLAMCPI